MVSRRAMHRTGLVAEPLHQSGWNFNEETHTPSSVQTRRSMTRTSRTVSDRKRQKLAVRWPGIPSSFLLAYTTLQSTQIH